jgi:CheY-like chemotaxis protein
MAVVLLAEDDVALQEIYATWLEDIGDVTVHTAATGGEAAARVDRSVDVAVLDRRMPGDEVARRVRSTHPDCDIVVVSAFGPDERGPAGDCDRYLTKPIRREQLVAAVERGIGGLVRPVR